MDWSLTAARPDGGGGAGRLGRAASGVGFGGRGVSARTERTQQTLQPEPEAGVAHRNSDMRRQVGVEGVRTTRPAADCSRRRDAGSGRPRAGRAHLRTPTILRLSRMRLAWACGGRPGRRRPRRMRSEAARPVEVLAGMAHVEEIWAAEEGVATLAARRLVGGGGPEGGGAE